MFEICLSNWIEVEYIWIYKSTHATEKIKIGHYGEAQAKQTIRWHLTSQTLTFDLLIFWIANKIQNAKHQLLKAVIADKVFHFRCMPKKFKIPLILPFFFIFSYLLYSLRFWNANISAFQALGFSNLYRMNQLWNVDTITKFAQAFQHISVSRANFPLIWIFIYLYFRFGDEENYSKIL